MQRCRSKFVWTSLWIVGHNNKFRGSSIFLTVRPFACLCLSSMICRYSILWAEGKFQSPGYYCLERRQHICRIAQSLGLNVNGDSDSGQRSGRRICHIVGPRDDDLKKMKSR